MTATLPLERFSAGDRLAIDPNAIERELAALWREAGKSTDTAHPVTRACLWNVVFHLEERPGFPGHRNPDAQLQTIADLPRHLAARTLVLRTHLESADSPELESWISARCLLAGDGSKLVCSEEITLSSRGHGERHLPSLVRALLVPAVPTAIVFSGVPDLDAPLVRGLIDSADRVIVRADLSQKSAPLDNIAKLADRPALSVMDLGWMNTSAWRREVAALFDPPMASGAADQLTHATISVGPTEHQTARLMLGWVGIALGATQPKSLDFQTNASTWQLTKPDGTDLIMGLHFEDTDCLRLELHAPHLSSPLTIEAHRDTETLDICTVEGQVDTKPLTRRNSAAILSRALSTRTHDRAFVHALRLAAELTS